MTFCVFMAIGDQESNNAEATENDVQADYEPDYKDPDGCGLEQECDSPDDDDETPETYESYDRWNTCGQYEVGKEDESYAYPSCSMYDSQYESLSVPTYESPSRYTSCSRYTRKNGVYYKCGASSTYDALNPYESSSAFYESPYGCEYSPTYEPQYNYEYAPSQESEYGYEPSSGYQSQYRYDNSPPYEWQYGYGTSPVYDVQYGLKNSPVYESPYEYDSSGYEWSTGQSEPQPRYILVQDTIGRNKLQKDSKSHGGGNEPHDTPEISSGGNDEAQGPKGAAHGNKASLGHNEPLVIRAIAGGTEQALPSDEQGNSQQNQLPNGAKKQLLDGSDGLLGGMKKLLDGTKKLLRRGNQFSKDQIQGGAMWSSGMNQLPNINSPPQMGIRQLQGRGSLQHGSSVLPDSSGWPRGERNPCLGTAAQPHVPRGGRWSRGGMTPHLPDISNKLLGRVNRLPGRCNFLPSHSSGSFNS